MAGQLAASGAQALTEYIGGISSSVLTAGSRYLALLTSDPSQAVAQNGGYAMNISDLVEDQTAGYARQAVTFAIPPTYASGTTYALGQQVFYNSYLYQCAVATSLGVAPPGTAGMSNANWTYVNNGYPATISNSNVITFGAYTAAQALPVQWAALVTVVSGTAGLLLYTWKLPAAQQVANSQSIQIGAGLLTIDQS